MLKHNDKQAIMKTLEAGTLISVEIINRMVVSLEVKLKSESLKNEVKYHGKQLNNYLSNDFKAVIEIIQNVVDKFYFDKYIVNSFMTLYLDDLDFCVSHNTSLVNSMKKILKYVS